MQSFNKEIAKTREFVNILHSSYPDLIEEEFKLVLHRKVTNWEKSTLNYLKNCDPFKKHRYELDFAEKEFRTYGACEKSIQNDLNKFKSFYPSVNVTFWKRKISAAKRKADRKENISRTHMLNVVRRNEQEAWRKEYEKQLLEWELKEFRRLRAQYLSYLEEWFETIEQMKEVFDELDIDTGLLWDLSAGELSEKDISLLKQWAESLKRDKNLARLCELMGRIQKEQQSDRTEIIDSTVQYRTRVLDRRSREMVAGIELGRDLENVIPQELALLSDSDVALLFDLKFAENRLMCFSRQGYKDEIIEEIIQEKVTVADEENTGPIIICVDTSASMAGTPENVAKALTLSLLSKAISQNRKCYLINFSTSIVTLDLTPPKGIRDLIDFLKMSFNGGTDVSTALYEGLRMMSEEDYKKADLLVISDFVHNDLPHDVVSFCKKQKRKDNRFFALSVGSFGIKRIDENVFDQVWIYQPHSGSISAEPALEQEYSLEIS